MRSRNSWEKDPEYIVNLTKHLIGKKALESIMEENRSARNPPRVIKGFVTAVIFNKIQKMNDATLGRICAYASPKGLHRYGRPLARSVRPSFINNTGIVDILGPHQADFFSYIGDGEYLEQIAIMVIACVVYDMTFQDKWQAAWGIAAKL